MIASQCLSSAIGSSTDFQRHEANNIMKASWVIFPWIVSLCTTSINKDVLVIMNTLNTEVPQNDPVAQKNHRSLYWYHLRQEHLKNGISSSISFFFQNYITKVNYINISMKTHISFIILLIYKLQLKWWNIYRVEPKVFIGHLATYSNRG